MNRQLEQSTITDETKQTVLRPVRGLIEAELIRERLYEALLVSVRTWLSDRPSKVRWSDIQISHILLRYIFNKKATISRPIPDPIFVIGTSSIARRQLYRDLEVMQVSDGIQLADLIDHELILAALDMCTTQIDMDESVILSPKMGGKLIYRNRIQNDFSRLAQRYGYEYYNAAYALGIRYSYLRLLNHGLARAYKNEAKLSSNYPLACECFASAFNHYFDNYYSAFPDLEVFFGSRGCFFKANWEREPDGITYYLNPPFDPSFMELCVDRIFDVLKHRLLPHAKFVFIVPGSWTDFTALEKLKSSPWTVNIIDYSQGQLPFIDHMAKEGRQIIYPTDICEVTITNSIT